MERDWLLALVTGSFLEFVLVDRVRSIKIFNVEGESHTLLSNLLGCVIYDVDSYFISHEGPVWQVSWSHPKFGSLLASCSYDGKVYIWKENNGAWSKIKDHSIHSASGTSLDHRSFLTTMLVNSISWAPHEYGLILACASSDGKVSILSYQGSFHLIQLMYIEDGTWELNTLNAHSIGVNTVSWAPSVVPGALFAPTVTNTHAPLRFASGGCDNTIKLWK